MPNRLCTIQQKTGTIVIVSIPGSDTSTARDVLEALRHQMAALAGNHDIKGVLVTGADNRFCRCLPGNCASLQDAAALSGFGQQIMFTIEKTGIPCIAVIEGECSGLGLEVALACDFIVASSSASFGFPGIAEGTIPFCGGSQRLARLIGKSKAKEMIYSGELFDADEAYRIGLINRLYPEGEALEQAELLLAHICTRSPHAIRIGGEVVDAGFDIDLATACILERDAFALCFSSFDQREGMQAFLDKRQPQFKGE